MTGKKSRTKGQVFERWFARWFRERYRNGDAQRGWQARFGGKEEADVKTQINGTDIGIHWELSHGATPSPWGKHKQAQRDCANKIPVVIVKRNRQKPMVFLALEDFGPFLDAYVEKIEWDGPLCQGSNTPQIENCIPPGHPKKE